MTSKRGPRSFGPGSKCWCKACRLVVVLTEVDRLEDGSPLYGWVTVNGANPVCTAGSRYHSPDRTHPRKRVPVSPRAVRS